MTDLSLIKSASDKVKKNLTLAAGMGHDEQSIKDVGIGYMIGAAEWLEAAMGPELTSEQLYRVADFIAGRAADARAQAGEGFATS